jgi:hypothetical protein
MSNDLLAGLNYALLKRFFDCDDYVSLIDPTTGVVLLNGITFTNVPTYYISGLMAYVNDNNVPNFEKGWCWFTHGQPAPAWLAPFLTALGLPWPTKVPAFEAKRITFLATQDCLVQFEGPNRVRQFIPAGTLAAGPYFTWNRRCFMFWVTRAGVNNGILYVWIEG